jgi:hypothetical protein
MGAIGIEADTGQVAKALCSMSGKPRAAGIALIVNSE